MCYNLIEIRKPYKGLDDKNDVIKVPCGHCLECLHDKQMQWQVRMTEELKSVGYKGVFFTLTYNEQSVPKNYVVPFRDQEIYSSEPEYNYTNVNRKLVKGERIKKALKPTSNLFKSGKYGQHSMSQVVALNSLRKQEVQMWLKRLRSYLPDGAALQSYFIAGEYGPTSLRPHYHGVLFGVTLDDVRDAFQDWKVRHGRYTADNVDPSKGGIGYVSKYVSKGFFENPNCAKDFFFRHKDGILTEWHSKHYDKCIEKYGIDKPVVEPSFILVSKGMGISYVKDFKQRYYHLHELENNKDMDTTEVIEMTTADNLDTIITNLKYITQQGYEVKLPKYYQAKMFRPFVLSQIKKVVRDRNAQIYQAKFKGLQSQYPTWSDDEIHNFLFVQELIDLRVRKQRAVEKTNKFLKQAKI